MAFASARAEFDQGVGPIPPGSQGPFPGFALVVADANGVCAPTCDGTSSAHAQIEASYQITVSGSTGPGYIQPELCVDTHGLSSGSFVTPNGSINSSAGCRVGEIPIVFGVPLDVQLTLLASSFNRGNLAPDGVGAWFALSEVLDAQMNPVAATVSIVIPEPSGGGPLIVAMGLFLMGARLVAWVGASQAKRIGGSPRTRHR